MSIAPGPWAQRRMGRGPDMRRVVVTGLGMVSPLACGVEPTWSRLLGGQSGARAIEGFDISDLPCKIAMPVPRGDGRRRDLQS